MSKQISFFHTELDIPRFIQEVESHGGLFLFNKIVMSTVSVEGIMREKMGTHSCKFGIISAELWTRHLQRLETIPLEGIIEFNNCHKGRPQSRTYEVGRLYIRANSNGIYTSEAIVLYELLRKFIKTNYCFIKKAGAYFAPDFLEKYNAHYFYATRAGRPVLNL